MRVALMLSLLVLAPVASQAAQPFSAERSWEIQRIGNPEVSPDGKHIVAPVTRAEMKEDKLLTDLWLWSADGSVQRPLTGDPAAESSPRFSPDGRTLAFVAQRDDDTAPQLYLLPLAGGEARRLTTFATGVSAPRWVGNERLVFASRVWADLPLDQQAGRLKEREESKVKAQVWDGGPVSVWDTLVDDRQGHVFSVAVASGEVRALTLGSGLELPRFSQGFEGSFDVSPDGRELAFAADSDPAINVSNIDVYLMPFAGGEARNLSAGNKGGDGSPLYSPDGRHLVFLQQRVPGFYAAKARPMLHDRRSGETRELHADWDRSASGLAWSRDGRTLYGAIDDAGTTRVYELPLAVIGAFPALLITNRPIGISALIGFLMLIGIVVTNAIVLLDRVEQLRHEGVPTKEALLRAGGTRVRPILMTAVATILALTPLAAGPSEGSIIAAELGTVVIGGLTREEVKTIDDKVPVLGSIPLIGAAFRSSGKSIQKKSLMVFVTANLVSPGGATLRSSHPGMRAGSTFSNPTLISPGGAVYREPVEVAAPTEATPVVAEPAK